MAGSQKTSRGIIGFDIGGTKMEGVFWRRGRIERALQTPTPKTLPRFLAALAAAAAALSRGGKVAGIGLGIAGALDQKSGRVIKSPNLPFLNGVAARALLAKRLAAPVRLMNDVNCFLLAEARFGLARGKKNVAALVLGTGSGGAALVDGRLLRGAHGAAGEFGHLIIAGDRGGLDIEDLASSHGFRRLGFSDPRRATAAAYRKIAFHLGLGLANLANVFDPELIVLGGGITKAKKFSLPAALKIMEKHSFLPAGYRPPVKVSKLPHAGALGAVLLFL